MSSYVSSWGEQLNQIYKWRKFVSSFGKYFFSSFFSFHMSVLTFLLIAKCLKLIRERRWWYWMRRLQKHIAVVFPVTFCTYLFVELSILPQKIVSFSLYFVMLIFRSILISYAVENLYSYLSLVLLNIVLAKLASAIE